MKSAVAAEISGFGLSFYVPRNSLTAPMSPSTLRNEPRRMPTSACRESFAARGPETHPVQIPGGWRSRAALQVWLKSDFGFAPELRGDYREGKLLGSLVPTLSDFSLMLMKGAFCIDPGI